MSRFKLLTDGFDICLALIPKQSEELAGAPDVQPLREIKIPE